MPQITDAEEPTVVDAVVGREPWLDYLGVDHERAVVYVELASGAFAAAIQDGPRPTTGLTLPETIAEAVDAGCHVRLFGRWANVQLMPPAEDDWPSGRMFVIDRYDVIHETDRR